MDSPPALPGAFASLMPSSLHRQAFHLRTTEDITKFIVRSASTMPIAIRSVRPAATELSEMTVVLLGMLSYEFSLYGREMNEVWSLDIAL